MKNILEITLLISLLSFSSSRLIQNKLESLSALEVSKKNQYQVKNEDESQILNQNRQTEQLQVFNEHKSNVLQSLLQAQGLNDPTANNDDNQQRFIWIVVLDAVACVAFCMFIMCMLSFSRKCKGNMANYNRKKSEKYRRNEFIASIRFKDEENINGHPLSEVKV